MGNINSIIALSKRELKINLINFTDIFSIIVFFLLGIVIFIFTIGTNKEIYDQINIGIIWTLILLSSTLSLRKFFQDDFDDNSIILFYMSGLSYEIIVLIKLFICWFCFQVPFFIIIPVAGVILNIEFNNLFIIFISF